MSQSTSLMYPPNSIWCTFPEFLRFWKITTWKKLTTWWSWASSLPHHLWCLRIDNCPVTSTSTHQRIVHTPITYSGTPVPHLVFKNALLYLVLQSTFLCSKLQVSLWPHMCQVHKLALGNTHNVLQRKPSNTASDTTSRLIQKTLT